jgi:hypothetical protein
MTKSKGPHISVFRVRKVAESEVQRPIFKDDECYILVELDGIPVTGKPVNITIRKERGVPRLVYIKGSWPLYETWVYDLEFNLIAHFGGLLAEKELDNERFQNS